MATEKNNRNRRNTRKSNETSRPTMHRFDDDNYDPRADAKFESEYLRESNKNFQPYHPQEESDGCIFNFIVYVIPVALMMWAVISFQQCQSESEQAEHDKMVMQDVKYNSCVDVVAIDKYAEDPEGESRRMQEEAESRPEPKEEPKMVWTNHNGDYKKCRKDFAKWIKYEQRAVVDPIHDPMYVNVKIKGDTLYFISTAFGKMITYSEFVWNQYKDQIRDCKFKEVRMCPFESQYKVYWKAGVDSLEFKVNGRYYKVKNPSL